MLFVLLVLIHFLLSSNSIFKYLQIIHELEKHSTFMVIEIQISIPIFTYWYFFPTVVESIVL